MATKTRTTQCPKCSGTGTVARFLDYKAGVCFDCNGAGTIAAIARRGRTPLGNARILGAAALEAGDATAAADALAALKDLQLGWGESDYALARQLGEVR